MINQEEPKEEYDLQGDKIIKTRQLTQEQKKYLKKNHTYHQTHLSKPQVVLGKTFKGDAFISKPDQIVFKDFTIGQTEAITIQLTNVSYSFNQFKVLPLKNTIRVNFYYKDYFQIKFTPTGRMSAGMSCPLTVKFTPQLNQDINDKLVIQAQTGIIQIPLKCTSKKAIIQCKNTTIDFGKVIYGEQCIKSLKLNNLGALGTQMLFKKQNGSNIDQQQVKNDSFQYSEQESKDQFSSKLSQLQFEKKNKINGYSTLVINIKYKPSIKGRLWIDLQLYFYEFMHSPPIIITIKGECVQVPIYVQKPLYDFQICLLNHIYRGQNAMKIQIVQPKETKNFFQFNPMLGYIQGQSKFQIWLKFTAERDLFNVCSRFMKTSEIFSIPFKLIGVDQVMPVLFNVKLNITSDQLSITPNKLNFGKLYQGTASRLSVVFQNNSQLPQQLIFYPLPKQISVQLDMIPIKILPNQRIQSQLIYRSQKLVGQSYKKDEGFLKCKIITGKIATMDSRISYSCQIIKSNLEFSFNRIDLPALQIAQKYSTNIELKNCGQKPIIFQFFVPPYQVCGLEITPMVKTLNPQQRSQINLQFSSFFKKIGPFTLKQLKAKDQANPQKNFQLHLRLKQQKKPAEQQPQKKDKKQSKKQAKKQQPKLTKAQQQQLQLQQKKQQEMQKQRQQQQKAKKQEALNNFKLQDELAKLGGKLRQFPHPINLPCPSLQSNEQVEVQNNYSQHYTWLIPCYFKVVNMPDASKNVSFIEINTVSVCKSLILSQTVIDFGQVAVGIRQIRQIEINNLSKCDRKISMQLLPAFSGFNVLNAMRTIQPSKLKPIVLQFKPFEQQPYQQKLKLMSTDTSVSCILKGKGVRPQVRIQPQNGLLNMGSILIQQFSQKSFKIKNISNFKIKFILVKKSKGVNNLNDTEVFAATPAEGYIQPNNQTQIQIKFKPDRISDRFYQYICIDVPFQKKKKHILIYGSSYSRQAYVAINKPYQALPQAHQIDIKSEYCFDSLHLKDQQLIFSHLNNRILLQFTKASNQKGHQNPKSCFQRKIKIGNCSLLDKKLEKPCNFQINLPVIYFYQKDQKFIVDNPKGTTAAGAQTVITFTYKPPQLDQFIAKIEALNGIGQWKQLKGQLKLSGGFIKPGITDLITFQILLKAYVNQI